MWVCHPGPAFAVCRNAGDIVPPMAQADSAVPAVIEYAVLAPDGALGRFVAVPEVDSLPVAIAPSRRVAADAVPATAAK